MEVADEAILWALLLLRENEIALIEQGREADIAFGRWLTKPHSNRRYVYDVVREDLPALVAGLIEMRLAVAYQRNGGFAQVSSVAAAAGLDRGTLFQAWHPRALLLIHLMHAYLVAVGDDRRWAALMFYSHDGWGSPEGTAYGLHRITSERTFSRLSGLAALGQDFVVPFSCMPHNVGLRCSPDHPQPDHKVLAKAVPDLAAFGIAAPPASQAEHFGVHLRIAEGAREVLEQARKGSRACGRIRVHPDAILQRAFPPWVAVGPLPSGVQAKPVPGPKARYMPGADRQLLQTISGHGFQPICVLFDTTEAAASDHALRDIMFVDGSNCYSGHQLRELLCSSSRLEVPGLRQEPPKALLSLARLARLHELGVAIDPTTVDWLWHPKGLRLLDGHGPGLKLGLVVRSTTTRHTCYVVLTDLQDAETRADIIACCDLHFLSASDPARSRCLERVFSDYELHALKPWLLPTRTWLRLAALLSNSPMVSVGRSHQAHLRS